MSLDDASDGYGVAAMGRNDNRVDASGVKSLLFQTLDALPNVVLYLCLSPSFPSFMTQSV